MPRDLTVYVDNDGREWKYGDPRQDGYLFIGLSALGTASFSSPESFRKRLERKRQLQREKYEDLCSDEETRRLREAVKLAQLKLRQHLSSRRLELKNSANPDQCKRCRTASKDHQKPTRTAQDERQRRAEINKRGKNRIKKTAVAVRVEMRPAYIANQLKIPVAALSKELLEAKRLQLTAVRKIKDITSLPPSRPRP